MTAKEIIELVITICSLIGVVAGLIPTIIALIKKVKEVIKNKDWSTIMALAQSAMTTVEEYAKEHEGMTSEDKLNMAVDTVEASLKTLGISYTDGTIDQLISYINQLCSWSKTVNN